jgi:hypothetical protein
LTQNNYTHYNLNNHHDLHPHNLQPPPSYSKDDLQSAAKFLSEQRDLFANGSSQTNPNSHDHIAQINSPSASPTIPHNTTQFPTLRVATHNINGLKGANTKLHHLISELNNYDIIGLYETNLCKQDAHFINQQISSYGKCIFSINSQNKVKGSGILLFITHRWSKHIGKITNPNDYLLSVSLFF